MSSEKEKQLEKQMEKFGKILEEDQEARLKALESAKLREIKDPLKELPFWKRPLTLLFWKRFITNPTIIWYSSWYVFVQLAVFGLKYARGTDQTFFETHEYYMHLILYYGLNAGSTKDPAVAHGFLAFLLLPFFVITILGTLFFLSDSGYALNGPHPLDTLNLSSWRYFDIPVFGADYYWHSAKFNLLYVPLLLVPIILATLLTFQYMRTTGKTSMLLDKVFIFFVMSWLTAWVMAGMTGTTLRLDWSQFDDTLFDHRKRNTFIVYDGYYHPSAIALTSWLISFLWVMFLNGLGSLVGTKIDLITPLKENWRNLRNALQKKEELLPWEDPSS